MTPKTAASKGYARKATVFVACAGNVRIADGDQWVSYTGESQCAECHRRLDNHKVFTVWGRYGESKGCNATCMEAIGPNCDCQCGGENHGTK